MRGHRFARFVFLKSKEFKMKKNAWLVLLACMSLPAWAEDAGRIAALEARIADLEKRILLLEHKNSQNIVIEHRRSRPPVFVCSVSAFGKAYEAVDSNEGLARLKVRNACQAEHNEMFCRDSDMKCQRYE